MSDKGWIKLHRQLLDCWIWQEKPFDKGRAWVDLILLATHKDKKLIIDNKITVISRGSFMTSILKLSDRWGWSRNKVKRFLELLESEQMLNTERTSNGTLVTIVKYEDYQCGEPTDEPTNEPSNEPSLEPTDEPQNKNERIKEYILCSNSLNETYIEEQEKKKIEKQQMEKELENNFEIIYKSYPKKVGKARGFDLYKGWLKGRDISGRKIKLTNRQMWSAIARYKQQLENDGTEKQYIKNFDTFMNKAILDYVGDDGE